MVPRGEIVKEIAATQAAAAATTPNTNTICLFQPVMVLLLPARGLNRNWNIGSGPRLAARLHI